MKLARFESANDDGQRVDCLQIGRLGELLGPFPLDPLKPFPRQVVSVEEFKIIHDNVAPIASVQCETGRKISLKLDVSERV